ncbi:hypothetical protein GCM10027535_11020 [Mycolicibacterium hippocampi]|uniref:Uncharacterized protein n=1 Tax=Mycolicibacterium hippocampi TaxID=659824 RepID=A0A7I9ZT89_9MYCO|nr:hypothetical protein MHIP_44400 [Mycolicibacterium hippocampi]
MSADCDEPDGSDGAAAATPGPTARLMPIPISATPANIPRPGLIGRRPRSQTATSTPQSWKKRTTPQQTSEGSARIVRSARSAKCEILTYLATDTLRRSEKRVADTRL